MFAKGPLHPAAVRAIPSSPAKTSLTTRLSLIEAPCVVTTNAIRHAVRPLCDQFIAGMTAEELVGQAVEIPPGPAAAPP